jgi:hypothetical protein
MTQSRTRAGNVPFMDYSNLVNTSSSSMTSSFTTQKRGSGKTWVMVREFDRGEEADNVRKNKEWAYFYAGKNIDGNRKSTEVENFVDDVAEVAVNRCSKCIKLIYKADSLQVIMFEDEEEQKFHDFDIMEMYKIRR